MTQIPIQSHRALDDVHMLIDIVSKLPLVLQNGKERNGTCVFFEYMTELMLDSN